MKTRLFITALMILGTLTPTTVVEAQTAVNGPYYATPSWDQTLPGSTRFLILANFNGEAVLDRETGLVWQRSPTSGLFSFATSSEHCLGTNTGNRFGWRLPTINELAGLFDPSAVASPPLPPGHPFTDFPLFGLITIPSSTGSSQVAGAHRAVQYFFFGPDNLFLSRGADYQEAEPEWVLCVRGGVDSSVQ
jgi:hypothetical protein